MPAPFIVFLTGASGAGKTTLLKAIKQELPASVVCFHFDDIGVPTVEEMISRYGSPSNWQKAMTVHWVNKLIREYNNTPVVIIEGQVNLAFISAAFKQTEFTQYEIILIHCDHTIRHKRLHEERNQPELINDTMDNWSNFLFNQATSMGVSILNTSFVNIDEIKEWFKQQLLKADLRYDNPFNLGK
jgi:dephospho-CoA kinase